MTWSRKKLVDLQRDLGYAEEIKTGMSIEQQRALVALTLELWDKVSRIETCSDETDQAMKYNPVKQK
ncbi:MAG TPA: hypothetical protein VMS09_00425 [Paenibacillus sp.]|uniref:hypothetical protein n=1 Tax=Paenibacillus sp. TaxID=58172 RepID=UPI0028D1EFC2|nr:hypothetical protein [Paenibacillus sp.]HUC90473.1 hypothetical protein [Paenibacillus sp.]